MIFVTLGSQKFQFNRLLKALDEQVSDGRITEEIFAQVGASDYKPKYYDYAGFLNRDEFAKEMEKADIVISHGGTGAIIGAVKKGKKVIAVPRLKQFGEHVDDHQLQLIEQFKELDLIFQCMDCNELYKAIDTVKKTSYQSYQSNTERIVESIEDYLESI